MILSDLLTTIAAILCNGTGLLLTVMVYRKPDSRTILYEGPKIQKRYRSRHWLAVAGFVVLGLAFLLQAVQLVK